MPDARLRAIQAASTRLPRFFQRGEQRRLRLLQNRAALDEFVDVGVLRH
jgi:hypothetical protein